MNPPTSAGRPLRVAVVVPAHWHYSMGGAEYQVKLLVDQLYESTGAEIGYFATRVSEQRDFDSHRVIEVGKNDGRRKYGHFWDFFNLQSALRKFAPDVIYQRVSCAYAGIAGRYARRFGVPMITHISSENDCQPAAPILKSLRRPHAILESRLAKSGIRDAAVLVAQTEDQRQLLKDNFARDAVLVRNFHPTPVRSEKTMDTLTVAWVANIKPLKRPELFLDIAEQLSDSPMIRFVMAGQPYPVAEHQASIERRINALDNVTYLGPISQEAVNALLNDAHLLVNTSIFEGFSNVFIQSWQRGTPVLTLGVNPDGLLNDSSLGNECQSTESAVAYIRSLLADSARLLSMGKYAREFADDAFSMDNASRLAGLIESTAAAWKT